MTQIWRLRHTNMAQPGIFLGRQHLEPEAKCVQLNTPRRPVEHPYRYFFRGQCTPRHYRVQIEFGHAQK